MDKLDYESNALPPIANPDLFDHTKAENEFLNAFNSGRLPHAWLITGPKGIGKATFSHRIARFILTRNSSSDNTASLFENNLNPDGSGGLDVDITSPICRRIISGGHPDFLNIERGIDEKTGKLRQAITVKEVRNDKDESRNIPVFFSKTPSEGGWRVMIVDSADDLNTHAANTLLKVIEEPPERALILLVSNNPARLLPTIRSRCRRLSLNFLSDQTIKELLIKYNPQTTSENLQQLITMAAGSIGLALELSNDGGFEIYKEVNEILNMIPEIDMVRLHRLGDKLNRDKTGDVVRHTYSLISKWLINVIKNVAIKNTGSLDGWLEVWETTGHMINKTESLNLDTKQTILNIFIAIKNISNRVGAN